MIMRKLLLSVLFLGWSMLLSAQYEGMEYYQEEDPAVKAKLEQWQDLKFGFFVHWGPYSQKRILRVMDNLFGRCQLDSTGYNNLLR